MVGKSRKNEMICNGFYAYFDAVGELIVQAQKEMPLCGSGSRHLVSRQQHLSWAYLFLHNLGQDLSLTSSKRSINTQGP
jgi:hypothetical protein